MTPSRLTATRRTHTRALLGVACALVGTAALMLAVGAGAQAPARPASYAAAAAASEAPAASRAGAPAPRERRPAEVDSSIMRIEREVFAYGTGGRRDPFTSLLTTSELRPLLGELRLVAVAVDPDGQNSVAILRDLNTKAQHRVRVGQLLGRMRVAHIRHRAVVFTIEELGYSRQETLALTDSTARTK